MVYLLTRNPLTGMAGREIAETVAYRRTTYRRLTISCSSRTPHYFSTSKVDVGISLKTGSFISLTFDHSKDLVLLAVKHLAHPGRHGVELLLGNRQVHVLLNANEALPVETLWPMLVLCKIPMVYVSFVQVFYDVC